MSKGDLLAGYGPDDGTKACDIRQRTIFVGSDCCTVRVWFVTGCVGIGRKGNAIAKCCCTANGGIDAEFAGVAADDDMFHPEFIEKLFKRCAEKGVGRGFTKKEIPGSGDKVFV